MKLSSFFCIAFCGLLLMATPAYADLDQKCLSQCFSGGNSSASCLPFCTYNLKPTQLQPNAPGVIIGQSHKLLEAPVPSSELLLSSPAVGKAPSKDYACVNQCVKDGWQYNLCEQRCTKKQCGPGDVHCKDLTGISAGPPMQGP